MTWSTDALQLFQSRTGYDTRVFVWIEPKDLTGNPATFGYWSGERDRSFDLGDGARAYYGVGSALDIGIDHYRIGTQIMTRTIYMDVNPSAEAIIRQYKLDFAPVTIDHALFRSTDGSLVDVQRRYEGFVNKASLPVPGPGQVGRISLDLVSAAQRGVMTVSASKSDASQRDRDPNDTFRVNNDIGVVGDDIWGALPTISVPAAR